MTMTTTATPETPRAQRKLPAALEAYRETIERALNEPILGVWPEGEKYCEADMPEAIGQALVRALHSHLANASIGFLYREEINIHGASVWGKASKIGGKLAFYSHLDFLIEINWSRWIILSPSQKLALIDHELSHCHRDDDDKYVMLPHDIEEFSSIARRWGTWRRGLTDFANALGEGAQLGLFTHD